MAAARASFQEVASAEGLAYGERAHWYNSVPAHEASIWADLQGKGEDLRRAIYRAYFVDDLNIGSADVLARLAQETSLDAADLRAALHEGRHRDEVAQQFQTAREIGVTGVPSYVAGQYLVVGAQPYAVYKQLIETAQRDAGATAQSSSPDRP
jgi:predicted DsbA family dithiol-disulfide isomerase